MVNKKGVRRRPPGSTQQSVEDEMINLSMALAKRKLEEGTASPQIIIHFLRLGTIREQVELEKAKNESKLIEAKASALRAAKDVEALYKNAVDAMRRYNGGGKNDSETDEDI